MFKKKRSTSSLRQAPPAPTTPSAASAAAQAFLKKSSEDATLVSAAAAAALRSHAASPTPIGEIQTKRMTRRGSVSSIGSAASNSRQPFSSGPQQRRGSNGSLTSRSFRSPSPGAHVGAPPVPAIPNAAVPPIPSKSAMRTASMESSTRVPAQPNGVKTGMNASMWASADTRSSKTPALNTNVARAQAASPIPDPNSPRSINFSRPMSPSSPIPASPNAPRVQTRPASSLGLTHEQYGRLHQRQGDERLRAASGTPTGSGRVTMVFDPSSRRMVPAIIQHDLAASPASAAALAAVNAPPQKMIFDPGSRRMVPASQAAPIPVRDYTHTASGEPARAMSLTSAHLAAARRMASPVGRVASPEAVAMAQGKSPPVAAQRLTSPAGSSRINRVSSPPPVAANNFSSAPAQRSSSMTAVPAPSADQIRAFQTRAAAMLARPQTELILPPQPQPQAQRPTSVLFKNPSTENTRAAAPSAAKPAAPTSSATAQFDTRRTVSLSSASAGPESPIQRLSRGDKSASPARSARFLDSPLLEVTKHKPPPRSASPGKSALKGHSPRNMSPADTRTRDSMAMSDAGSTVSDESNATGKKKKSVRVSFEDRPILVGTSATNGSPTETVLSPQYKKALREVGSDDESYSMGDRPVLPSFGSVRGRKTTSGDDSTSPEPDSPTTLVKPSAETLKQAAAEPATSSIVAAPNIAVLPATPRAEDVHDWGSDAVATTAEETPSTEAVAASHNDYSNEVDDHPWVATHPHDDGSDTEDDQFNDAPESPDERAGFNSLDAILESPSAEDPPTIVDAIVEEPVESPVVEKEVVPVPVAVATTADTAIPMSVTAAPIAAAAAAEAGQGEDWELVKQYWSSLSEQRKREIESQANGDTGASELESTPAAEPMYSQTVPAARSAAPAAAPLPKPAKAATKKAAPVQSAALDAQRLPPWPDKQYQQTAKPVQRPATLNREPSDPTHLRSSMRTGGSLRTSMHDAPIAKSSRNDGKPTKPDPMTNASAEAIALARQFMPKPEPKRRGSNDSDASDSSFKKGRGRDPAPRTAAFSMKRSMRDVAAAPSLRSEMSPTASASGRKPMRGSVRTGSIDSTTSEPKGGFLGLGKKKAAPKGKSKTKSKPSGGLGFKSRFNDSSDEDSDGGGRFGFSSRFNDSDDDSDFEAAPVLPRIPANASIPLSGSLRPSAPAQKADSTPTKSSIPASVSAPAMPTVQDLTPVRGIPRKTGQEDAESTDLSDSEDDTARAPRAAAPVPANATHRPGTPPASTVLDFGNKSAEPVSPQSPTTVHVNGHAGGANVPEGRMLETGTLRNRADSSEKRRSMFSLGGKKKSSALAESKWANSPEPASPQQPDRPETPSRMTKTLRQNKESPRSSSRHSIFRRLSIGQSLSAPTSPATPGQGTTNGKADFPYPPPPIPEEFRTTMNRPITSDGVSSTGRPPLGERGESTQTAPLTGEAQDGRRRLRKPAAEPVFSERTGKKKRFTGLRRALGLHD